MQFTMTKPLCTLALSLLAALAPAQDTKWSAEAPAGLKWHRVTETGTYLFVSDKGLSGFDPETGKLLWTRPEFGKVLEFNVEEIPGLPLLFISENSGFANKTSKLTAINSETGQNLWETEKLKGQMLDIVGNRAGGYVVAITAESPGAKSALHYMGFETVSGKLLFEGIVKDKADLYANEKGSKFMPRLDLDGHAAPTFEGDFMYLAYSGLHKIDTNSGNVVWGAPFDVTEGHYKRTNASPLVSGDLVFSSAKGIIRAFDKNSGAARWTSADFGAAIPELQLHNGVLLARMGGTYYETNKRAFELKKPLGIVALDPATGKLLWRYDGAKESTTNMVFDPASSSILIADARTLIGLRVDGGNEAFRVPLEFKRHGSAGKKAAKMAGKFALGGVRAMAKKDNSEEDFPIALVRRSNGTVVVRAKQHLLSFQPAEKAVAWGIEYKAPGLPGWQKVATTAAFAMSYYMNTGQALNTQLGTSANTRANDARQNDISGMFGSWEKRFSAARASQNYAFMLTDVEADKGTAPGIVGVNLDTGETDHEVLFRDREPDYVVDELHGIVVWVHKNGKQIQAAALK